MRRRQSESSISGRSNRQRVEPQPLIADTTNVPETKEDSIAMIALQVHNISKPDRPFVVAEALVTWHSRLQRFLELERVHRSYTILDIFKKAIYALAGERLTGRAVCETRYKLAQPDLWEVVM